MKVAVVLLGLVILCSFLSWRRCVHLALVIVVLEGALRKWFLPGQEIAILLLKDVVLLISYAKYHKECGFERLKSIPVSISAFMVVSFIAGLLDVFNPELTSPIVGLYGMKAYFFYVPLMWMGLDFFDQPERLDALVKLQLKIAIPVFVLAYFQFFAPADSFLNSYATSLGEKLDAATVGESGNVRVTGTFPYLSGMGNFVTLITLLSLWAFIFSGNRRRALSLGVLFMAIVVGFMTGSRSVVFCQIPLVAMALFFSQTSNKAGIVTKFRWLFVAMVIGALGYFAETRIAAGAFWERVQSLDNTGESIWGPFVAVYDATKSAGFAGYGTGATHQARVGIEQLLGLSGGGQNPSDLFEWEYPRIMLELGPVGFATWFLPRVLLAFLPFVAARSMTTLARRSFCRLLGVSMVLQITIPNVFNHVYSLYFWLLAGLPLAMRSWKTEGGATRPASSMMHGMRAPFSRLAPRSPVPRPAH